MAKVTVEIMDNGDGILVTAVSDPDFPEDRSEETPAQAMGMDFVLALIGQLDDVNEVLEQ